jgi:hypothetical protein
MKIVVIILSLLNGGFMLADGIYVLINGKYIGPEKPGPWANIFQLFNIDVFKLGPMFMLFGLAWLCFTATYISNFDCAFTFGLIMCILTLWYLPVGTIFSLIILVLLIVLRLKSR